MINVNENQKNNIDLSKFGRDHWSLLAYVHAVCTESSNVLVALNRNKLRCKDKLNWRREWGTRLKTDKKINFLDQDELEQAIKNKYILPEHDDLDCLSDFECNGLIKIVNLKRTKIELTEKGLSISTQLNAAKINGVKFADFELPK